MNVRKFFANDARIALKKVKETLGDDAVILSNRTVDGQVEIMAVAGRDMAMIVSTPGRDQHSRELPISDDRVTLSRGASSSSGAPAFQSGAKYQPDRNMDVPASANSALNPSSRLPTSSQNAASVGSAGKRPVNSPPVSEGASTQAAKEMMDELKALRKIVEQHLAGYAWGEFSRSQPEKTELLRQLLDAGFSPRLVDQWLGMVQPGESAAEALLLVKAAAERGLSTLAAEDDVIERGGVFALVGPTGVGKTTTTAKLAARCVLRHGRDKVALITTDGYRIGAHEQLRIYGRILGVPVFVAKDAEELRQTLLQLSDKHLVLIDTMGMSQRDRNVAGQIQMFDGCKVERLLLLAATARGDTMDDVIAAYGGGSLSACVLTKIDETVSLAPAIDAVIRHQLPIAFVCNGQRVPEDMHLPNRPYLIHRAFKESSEGSPHKHQGMEPAMVMAGSGYFPAKARHV